MTFSGSIGGKIGSKWTKILVASDPFIHIDSGPFGIVNAVSRKGKIFSRWGISKENPQGSGWDEVQQYPSYEGQKSNVYRSVACGSFGCWATDRVGSVFFRHGITPHKTLGERFYTCIYEWLKIGIFISVVPTS